MPNAEHCSKGVSSCVLNTFARTGKQELDTTLQVLGIDGVPAEFSVFSPHALAALRRDSSSGFRLHHSESGGTLRWLSNARTDLADLASAISCIVLPHVSRWCILCMCGAVFGCRRPV